MRAIARYDLIRETEEWAEDQNSSFHTRAKSETEHIGLIEAFNAGSETAFTRVYHILFPPVFYFAQQQVPLEIAKDFTADLFAQLWQQEKKFDTIPQLKTYLQVAIRNRCTSYYRHEQIKQKHIHFVTSENADSINPLNNEIQDLLLNRLYEAIDQMPPQRRKIFQMAYLESYKEKEIARLLRISVNTVHGQKVKALQFLRLHFIQPTVIFFLFLFFGQ